MSSDVLAYEDITEKIIVFKLSKSYRENMTETELYDCTRGCWGVDLKRAQRIDYAFCVYENIIKEVYKIEEWLPAEELQRETVTNKRDESGKYGFKGKIAEEIRDKYLGHLSMIFDAKWQNFCVRKNTYANAGISTRFLTVKPAAMISLP